MRKPQNCPKYELTKSFLNSGIFLKFLYEGNKDVEALNREIESHKSDSNSVSIRSIIQRENEKFIEKIKENFRDNDQIKCCRDINYYFDLLNAIIKSPNVFSKNIQDDVINKFEEQWKEIIRVKNIDICTRETDLDSIRKRCIIKHLYDLKMDVNFIKAFSDDYNKYLVDKWKKIIEYTNTYYGGVYIKIENDSMGIIEKYDDFLKSSYFICDSGLNKLNIDDITISTDVNSLINSISLDKITSKEIQEGCFNKNYIELLKIKTSDIQRMINMLTIGISLLGFALILIFLYRFSPLGNLLRRHTKKNIEVDENTSEEMHELYENSENGRQYISYHSV
ncbi:PIR Superfamily Protein [Plasmodium ovale wallikeri]|uniref:PIR Superfamily Protein n=1 Tax=Plasmodium ovale wallikeri TaxID=864142 RepID=A0A1A8YP84_PLAOA|nr:PIR Superfamily Protein [Plasmodium ovale wallikeri]